MVAILHVQQIGPILHLWIQFYMQFVNITIPLKEKKHSFFRRMKSRMLNHQTVDT